MDFIFILFAFVCGFAFNLLNLPALIGFLIAGFVLNFLGYSFNENLQVLADLGITLMLFTVGLKINVKDLLKQEVWSTASLHIGAWMLTGMFGLLVFSALGLGYFLGVDLQAAALLVFALSFSSTVCIVKILEESGEMKTRHGKLAIGVLIMQDIIAVLFLVVAAGKVPTIWALLLFALIPLRKWIGKLLSKAGHGELLPLCGFLFALGAYELFELVGVKGDFGALIVGMLLASHKKANELAKSLLSFKDLFLIGFFLSVGFTALPDWDMLYTAALLCLLLPVKFFLFYFFFTLLKLRARTAFLASRVLSNFSEFGLIVVALVVSQGWLANEWLVILAISVSISFIVTGVTYRNSHIQYRRFKDLICRFERKKRLSEDIYPSLNQAEILVIGLGRVGKGAFLSLSQAAGHKVLGMDADHNRVEKLCKENMKVITGDGEDVDFWENTNISGIRLVLIALPSIEDICNIADQLKGAGYKGKIAAIARYEDESHALMEAGTDKVFNFFTEAGIGFAEESLQLITTDA